jgi:hypothetical protein
MKYLSTLDNPAIPRNQANIALSLYRCTDESREADPRLFCMPAYFRGAAYFCQWIRNQQNSDFFPLQVTISYPHASRNKQYNIVICIFIALQQ